MLTLSAHQPAYLPWLGYFDKIARSDVFVFLDTVQFEKNSFTNRNKIKTPQGPLWLTVPVKGKGHLSSSLRFTQIDNAQAWRVNHVKSIDLNYRKSPFFCERFPDVEALVNMRGEYLSDYCFDHLMFWCEKLGIKTRVVRSSSLSLLGHKSDLIYDLCQQFDATCYLSGALGVNYLDESKFRASGIRVEYQRFVTRVYPQLWGDFVSNLSVLDWWLNGGDELQMG